MRYRIRETRHKPDRSPYADPVEWVGPDDSRYAASGLIYCVRPPKGVDPDRPVPAIVMVHGWGGDESVMWIFRQVIPPGAAAFTPRAPIRLEEGGYIWFRYHDQGKRPDLTALQESTARLEHFLVTLPSLHSIDPNRLILIGFSQGATISSSLALTRPDLVAGLASISGLVPEIPTATQQTGLLTGLPVFIAHGIRDEVIPLSEAWRARDTYTRLGAKVTYGEYPVGHKLHIRSRNDLKVWVAKVITQTRPGE